MKERTAHTLFDDWFANLVQYLKFLDVQRERCPWEEESVVGLRGQPFWIATGALEDDNVSIKP